ncbi:putative 3-oxoacyl-[acyl-carrier-] synthase domain protein [Mycobacterium xenopi 3993]|nr:putative 3-oxoacyl-[acyl-carrier-] synthase domain protein [Mycobacterium xenopi 3993]
MTEVSLTDVSTYLPGEPISADYYAQFAGSDELRDNLMFRAPKFRHHVGPDESAIDMVEQAAQGLIERHGRDVIENVDVLITHTQMPDMPFYGAGGASPTAWACAHPGCWICTTAGARHLCSGSTSPVNC